MEKIKLIKDWYIGLGKKTKIVIAIGVVVIIGIIVNS
jgi:flagellar biosynthesis/type III secretory pathway M-ring protein FliF/YscJ|tara:strand:+ start:1750 stop:1860 length:111 start_codon:yes stop_codon:yes gene_type:complete